MVVRIIKSIFWKSVKNTWIPNKYYFLRNKSRLHEWRNKDFVLIHIPKTAGISISRSMKMVDPGHFTYDQLNALGILDNKREIWITVRNPTDRLVSVYNYLCQTQPTSSDGPLYWLSRYKTLNEFIKNGLTEVVINNNIFFRPQIDYLPLKDDSRITYINFEYLAEEFKVLCERNNIDAKLMHQNKKPKFDVEISEESIEILKKFYKKDYILFEKVNQNKS